MVVVANVTVLVEACLSPEWVVSELAPAIDPTAQGKGDARVRPVPVTELSDASTRETYLFAANEPVYTISNDP
jgi:hypothetical protein